jgi:hypothetical protein
LWLRCCWRLTRPLLRLLNSTPLGMVTSIHKVARQMNAAG